MAGLSEQTGPFRRTWLKQGVNGGPVAFTSMRKKGSFFEKSNM